MDYIYQNIVDFKKKHTDRAEWPEILRQLEPEEIDHLAGTCRSPRDRAWFAQQADEAYYRRLLAPVSEDLEEYWQKCQNVRRQCRNKEVGEEGNQQISIVIRIERRK